MLVTLLLWTSRQQILARTGEPHSTRQAEGRRAEKHLESRLKSTRTNTCNLGQLFKMDRFGQVGAEPVKGARQVSWQYRWHISKRRCFRLRLGDRTGRRHSWGIPYRKGCTIHHSPNLGVY